MRGKIGQLLTGLFLLVAVALLGWWSRQELLASAKLQALESPLAPQELSQVLKEPYKFVAFGDWGAGTPFQQDVASQLAMELDKDPYEAALLLGDNIYPDGNIQKFGKPYFTDMYGALIRQNVHFIVAIGNHDIVGGHQADQLSFFKMPGYYYSVKKPGVEFFVIDTNHFANDQVQQQWLKQALSASTSTWKAVVGHHPVYSSGEHGSNQGLKDTLEPLLIDYRVNLYLAGHDHNYERFKPIHGVQYIVSGGGGAYLRNVDKPLPQSLIYLKAHHFLDFELKGNQLKMRVVDKTGSTIDQAQWVQPALRPQALPHKKQACVRKCVR
ncbi:metallophosphoesterase [Vampirovibrio sp.]|uniref:metallophosphoesterase n=1 Tax=Vampirovibrio sp. TaxID=2717857 RepID=UPI0035930324